MAYASISEVRSFFNALDTPVWVSSPTPSPCRSSNPPHIHAEYQGQKAVFDFSGNVARGDLGSRTATRLVREWIDLHVEELRAGWALAQVGREVEKIAPLD